MVRTITSLLDQVITALPVGRRVSWAEVIDGTPCEKVGPGEFAPIITDAHGGVSYWRADGAITTNPLKITGCGDAISISMPLILVGFVRRGACDDPTSALAAAANQLNESMRLVRQAVPGAFGVGLSSVRLGVDVVRTREIPGFVVPADIVVLSMAFSLTVEASAGACLDPCADPEDPLCRLIGAQRWARIRACLTEGQVAAAIADLCDGSGPCNPLSYSLSDSHGNVLLNGLENDPCGKQLDLIAPDATVTRDGQPFWTVPSGGTIDVPSDCPECDPSLDLRLNSGRVFLNVPLDCGVNDYDILVTRQNGDPVGTWDAVDERIEIAPGTVQLEDSAANPIGSPANVQPESTGNIITAPDGTVNVRNSVPTILIAQAVRSGATVNADVADGTITRPDGTTFGLPATQALDIRTLRSGIVYQFGAILWSGQSTSFRTGDEADLWAAGWFNYNRPVYPLTYARLGADRMTLAENNIHGNTNRFTDQSGGQTYANDIVQDHLTGLEWYRVLQGAATWNDAIDGAVALNIGGNTDWRLPPSKVLDSIANDQSGSVSGALNYAPFSISGANYWTSSTYMPTTTSAFRMASQQLSAIGKGGVNGAWIACRKFL